ncbi:MAG: hypothetical protein LC739_04110 [Actinobacteria bacterium]|nr:hypothetical protein [Actinomycetota bacterium]
MDVVIEILLDPTLRNEEQPGLGFGVAAVLIGLVAGSGLLSPGLPSSRQIRIASIVLAFFGAILFCALLRF